MSEPTSYKYLIRYIWRKRFISDPVREAELMQRYFRRYKTKRPPSRFIPMKYEILKDRKRLSQEELSDLKDELGLTWKEIADTCGVTDVTLHYHRKKPELPTKYQIPIVKLFLEKIKERDGKKTPEVMEEINQWTPQDIKKPRVSEKKVASETVDLPNEFKAMIQIDEILSDLDTGERRRTMTWVKEKYNYDL